MNNPAIELDRIFRNHMTADRYGKNSMCIPFCVLMAHTCELCIKAILDNQAINIEARECQIHDLYRLFNMIDIKTQESLINDTQEIYKKNIQKTYM